MSPKESDRSYVQKARKDERRTAGAVDRRGGPQTSLEAEGTRLENGGAQTLGSPRPGQKDEQSRWSREMKAMVEENRELASRCARLQRQSGVLASLYTASLQLHGSLERNEVLKAIEEIVVGFVGCEEMAILEVDHEAKRLRRIASFGLEEGRLASPSLGAGLIGHAIASGETFVADGERPDLKPTAEEADLTACVPLKVDGKVTGIVVLFRLLSHKLGLEEPDREMFDLLATQAATALYCADLHARYVRASQ